MLFRWFEHSQVYHPSREMETTGAELARPFENVFFKTTDDVELNAWFFPAENSPRANLAVLICHGNGGNISHRLNLYRILLTLRLNVFAFDYRGYGRSAGVPGEEGTYLDAQAAHHWLAGKGFEKIIAYGESLGGGVASELCLREKPCGLILQGTFTSIPDIGKEFYPWLPVARIAKIRYDTLSKLPRLKIPVMIMHSRRDEVVGFHHSGKNFAAANEPKIFWELDGEHNDPFGESARFAEGIEKFLRLAEQHRESQTSAMV